MRAERTERRKALSEIATDTSLRDIRGFPTARKEIVNILAHSGTERAAP